MWASLYCYRVSDTQNAYLRPFIFGQSLHILESGQTGSSACFKDETEECLTQHMFLSGRGHSVGTKLQLAAHIIRLIFTRCQSSL